MSTLSRSRIATLVESQGAEVVSLKLSEAIKAGEIKQSEISLREIAEGFLGYDTVRRWQDSSGGFQMLMEAGDPVTMRAFTNTVGGLVMAAMEEGYRKPAYIGEQLVSVVPTTKRLERIGFPGAIEGTDLDVREGSELPTVGFSEQYIDTPETTKKGAFISVTREMVLGDETRRVVEQANYVGEFVGSQKEKKILRGVFGIDNPFSWNGTAYNTYLTSGSWTNSATNVLVDHSNIEAAEVAISKLTDPVSGDPIACMPDTIVVPPTKALTAERLATSPMLEVRTSSGSNIATQTNPYVKRYSGRVFSSPFIYSLLVASGLTDDQAGKVWILGDTRGAFQYRENWPLTLIAVGPDHRREAELQFKASERGVFVVREPRKVYKSIY
ncbi:MAG: hypothetical protein KF805_12485 [Phycisphaeraceae bacterium]|nr:hypothetical protein [Phycisphaeraceae bacterium]